jgi:hypothetical protein
MKNSNILLAVAGLAFSFAVIYGYTYVIGKSWKASQK